MNNWNDQDDPRTVRDAIHTYIRMNNIPFTDTLANTFSILWTLVIILAMITFLVKSRHGVWKIY